MEALIHSNDKEAELAGTEANGEEQIYGRPTADADRRFNARNHGGMGGLWTSNERS